MLYIFSRFIMWFFSEEASLIFLQVCLLRQRRLPAEQVAEMLLGKMLAATPVDTGTEHGSAQPPGVAPSSRQPHPAHPVLLCIPEPVLPALSLPPRLEEQPLLPPHSLCTCR